MIIEWHKLRVFKDFKEVKYYATYRDKMLTACDAIGIDIAQAEFNGKIYQVAYTLEKAKELGIEYTDWDKADFSNLKTPCYVRFYDDWVGLVFEVVASLGSVVLMTPLGQRPVTSGSNSKLKIIKPYFNLVNKPVTYTSGKVDTKTKKYMVAKMMSAGCSVEEIAAFFKRDTSLNTKSKIKTIMMKKDVREMATKMVKEALNERGIDPNFVIDWALEAQNLIKTTKNAKAYVELIKEVANWAGFNDKDTETTTQSVELIDYHKDLKSLEEKKQSAKLTQTVEKEIE